ncbi:hypothetical protein [Haladaptatus sp. NG-SE-30]
MRGEQYQFNGDAGILHQQAVRTPLPDKETERVFHENMMSVADARERKAELLADPNVSVLDAYETELDSVVEGFKRRLRHIAGNDYTAVAMAYNRGEQNDRIGALTSYYLEGLWRVQQRITITAMLFFPIIIRYPDSFTVNIRFADEHITTESVVFESPEHLSEELDDKYATTYYEESLYTQKQAADYIRETAQIIREEFPDPDETPFEERKYGGIVTAGGRRGSVFSDMLTRIEPDPNRFTESVSEPTLVKEGTEAKQTERELLPDGDVVI